MKPNRICFFTITIFLFVSWVAAAQKQKPQPVKSVHQPATKKIESPKTKQPSQSTDLAEDEKKVKDMIAFLGYMLNTLGSSSTSARDKEVLIADSYAKIFRDGKVQVEDDLDEHRSVITNKDVVAYLKDINFFFKDVRFELNIDKITRGVNSDNQTFYKVSLHRNLTGTTSDGKSVDNTSPRFVEVNFNPKDQDLKIVSIYTKEFDERAALTRWWNELSLEWQTIFRKKFNITDSIQVSDIKRFTSVEELDITDDKMVQSFDPLSELRSLKSLHLAGTNIDDLSPIRNLGELVELNLSHTHVRELGALKYFSKLITLNLNTTNVSDISILQRMQKLQSLDLGLTKINDLSALSTLTDLVSVNLQATHFTDLFPVQGLTKLSELNISRTSVQDLSSLKTLKNLVTLNCDSTRVQTVATLADLENLKMLSANSTQISDLQPLQKLTRLEMVYCDHSAITKALADAFMLAHPKVTIIYNSHDLKAWWSALTPEWKMVLTKGAKLPDQPSDEDLSRIGNLDSINVFGHVKDLEPLKKFPRLRVVVARKTSIQDLTAIKEHKEIRYLDVSETEVTDLSPIAQFSKLSTFKAEGCKIASIGPLQKITSLQRIYVDETSINDINAVEFLQTNSRCLLIYKTVHLRRWWRNLSGGWRDVFLGQLRDTTRENLHKLVEQESFHFQDAPISDLSGLSEFMRLKELRFSGTSITQVVLSENLKSLRSLQASNSPIQTIQFVGFLVELENLDISNTPVEDITPVWTLQKLKTLNCAGTQIRRLDALEKTESLETLDCSNTNVSKLTPLDYLHLSSLKCYNTRVTNKSIENFIASHPNCKVVYYR
jgi:hypothetical protein